MKYQYFKRHYIDQGSYEMYRLPVHIKEMDKNTKYEYYSHIFNDWMEGVGRDLFEKTYKRMKDKDVMLDML